MAEQRTEDLLRENVDLIRTAYTATGSGDVDTVLADIVHPDVVIRDRPESPDPRTYHGHAGVRQALESSEELFEDFRLQPEEFIAEGDHVIVVLNMSGTGRGSGATVEERIAHQWKIHDGKAVALQVYSDPADALRDAQAS